MKYISLFFLIITIALSCNKELEITEVYTGEIQSVTSNTVVCLGEVSSNGNPDISERGICWSTSTNPTIDINKSITPSEQDSFTVSITGLEPETNYYIKAYAVINSSVVYGGQEQFITKTPPSSPTVTTINIVDITDNLASCNGEVINDGGSAILARGFCWRNTPYPNIDNANVLEDELAEIGNFTIDLTALDSNETYYIKAYATNSIGTAYGEEKSFTTDCVEIYIGDVVLTTQLEINEFGTGCYTQITGSLNIEESIEGDIVDLTPLGELTQIGGDFLIKGNAELSTIDALSSIITVGASITIRNNSKLMSLSGLMGLEHVVENLFIINNDVLSNLDGLEGLTSVGNWLGITDNHDLFDLTALSHLASIGGNLTFENNDALYNLEGLSSLESIGGSFNLTYSELSTIDGLTSLTSVGSVFFYGSDSLQNLDGFSTLSSCAGQLYIYDCNALTDFCGLSTLIEAGGLGGAYNVHSNLYNPTVSQIITEECSGSSGL